MFILNNLFGNKDDYEPIPQYNEARQPQQANSNSLPSSSSSTYKPQPPYTTNATAYNQQNGPQNHHNSPKISILSMKYNAVESPNQKKSRNGSATLATEDSDDEIDSNIPRAARTTCCQDLDAAMTLTRCERIFGFVLLFFLGWGLSLTTLSSYKTIFYTPRSFCLWYTIGNILALCSNFFLYGPAKHCKSMFRSPHRIPSLVYVTGIGLTLWCALSGVPIRFTIAAVVFQFIGSIIFTLSYIINGVFGKAICWFVRYSQSVIDNTGPGGEYDPL